MGVGRFWAEVWDRPGAANYGRKIADLAVESAGFTKRHTGVGQGNADLPRGSADSASILSVDPDTPANSVWSTIKIFNESSPATPVMEWLPDPVLPAVAKTDTVDKISGAGIESVVGFARVEPFDWDGSDDFESVDPNWSFGGGVNLLQNPGFENNAFPNGGFEDGSTAYWNPTEGDGFITNASSVEVVINPAAAQAGNFYGLVNVGGTRKTGATRTLTGLVVGDSYTVVGYMQDPTASGDRWRAGIAGASDATHTNAYEEDEYWWAEVGNATMGNGASDGTWQSFTLTFVAAEPSATLVIIYDDTGTPLNFRIDSWTMIGENVGLAPWEGAAYADLLTIFDINTVNVLEGIQSVRVRGSAFIPPFKANWTQPGIRQDVTLIQGKTYTGEAWVYHAAGSNQTFAISVRQHVFVDDQPDGGELIMFSSGNVTVPTATWTRLRCTGVATQSDAVIRVNWKYTGAHDALAHQSPIFYVDQASLREGLPATTVGEMFKLLYEEAIDTNLRNPIVWDDGSGTDTPYLTLDFDETNDSGAVAWDNDEVGLLFNARMSYLQVLERIAQLGYQWRVVPDAVVGYYLLQLYNPGGLGSAQGAIQTGSVDVSNQSRYIRPFSDIVVQGAGNVSARDRNTDLLTAFGRIEASTLDPNIATLADGSVAAADALADALVNSEALIITTVPQEGVPEPLVDYDVGDTLTVGRASGVSSRQLNELEVSWGPTVEYTHKFGSVVVSGPGAIGSAVNYLLTRFQRADDNPAIPLLRGGDGGGAPTVVVAASDATQWSKDKADFICTGVNDEITIQSAIDASVTASSFGGRVLLTEGTFNVAPSGINVRDLIHLQGLGMHRTRLLASSVGLVSDYLINLDTDGELSNLWVQGMTNYAGTLVESHYGRIDHVNLSGDANIGFDLDGVQHPVHSLLINGDFTRAAILLTEGWAGVEGVLIFGTGPAIEITGSAAQVSVLSNIIISHAISAGNGIVFTGGTASLTLSGFAIDTPGNACIVVDDASPTLLTLNGGGLQGENGLLMTGTFPSLEGVEMSDVVIRPTGVGLRLLNVTLSGFSDIRIWRAGEHGIHATDCYDSDFDRITVYHPGEDTDNTYDGIILDGDSDRNTIRARVIGRATANQPRYGINISAATCNDNVYVGCRTGPATDYGTAPYNDAGTGTVNTWPGAAAPQGDNFL